MNNFKSAYISKPVDANGNANYTIEDNAVWATLYKRQLPIVTAYACDEYLNGLNLLGLPNDRVPQCPEISAALKKATGWQMESVAALIPAIQFFTLIANKKFPAATFVRRHEELDYLEEPDMFHEAFGHCPLLTNQAYADFTAMYGKLALAASEEDREMLARLYWFTIEFGLINTKKGLRAYGGGILSSYGETQYCIDSSMPQRKPYDPIEILRTPYRIDIMQPVYFVIDSFDVLFQLADMDIMALIAEAKRLGMRKPLFEEKVN
jgi:phenylalanine-4-hydroxylase